MKELFKKFRENVTMGELAVHSIGAGFVVGILMVALDSYGKSRAWW